MSALYTTDSVIFNLIEREKARQQNTLNLIASENYASPAVLEATGSVLTNKYAEGYAGKRYYQGCQHVDAVETVAIERCLQLFGPDYHANVQPHAGSQANIAAYLAVLKPGDTILGMSLNEGGHLTHGHPVNISGMVFNSVQYSVNRETECLDYEAIEKLAHQVKPKLIIAGASAYSRIIDFERFSAIARSCGALLMADMAHIAGLIAAGVHPAAYGYADIITSTTHKTLRGPRGGLILCKKELASVVDKAIMPGSQGGPFMHIIAAKAVAFHEALQPEFVLYQHQVIENAKIMAHTLQQKGYRIVSGQTENHLFVVDLTNRKITGYQAALALEKAGIIVSKSCIPFDTQKPWVTSGIRIGTPAITSRGLEVEHVKHLACLVDEALAAHADDVHLATIRLAVEQLCRQFPAYHQQAFPPHRAVGL